MNCDETFKLPRLYVDQPLKEQNRIELSPEQAHYLGTVLRRKPGDHIRLFNGSEGEWLAALEAISKTAAISSLVKQLEKQPQNSQRIHLFFSPIKKHRLDWMIEKTVELGVTDFHPILSQNTDIRKINAPRLKRQIFEAAEQCERLAIPQLHTLKKVEIALDSWDQTQPIFSCLERYDAQALSRQNDSFALVIGPEGGFTKDEKDYLARHTTPISLGHNVLRCETAAIKALILAMA